MSKARNRRSLRPLVAACDRVVLRCLHSTGLRAGTYVPPPSKPTMVAHVGGNSFLGPRDIIYVPTRPESDTLCRHVLRRLA